MSKLSFLDGEPSEAEPVSAAETQPPEPVPASPPPPPPQPQPEPAAPAQPRAADGKFAPKAGDAPPEPQPAPVVAAPAPPAPEPGHVPIGAMLDEREKRQALEKRVAEFETAQAKAKADAEAARTRPPEFTEDPLAHLDARDAEFQARLYYQNREFSRRWAVKEYGKETVEKVTEWAKSKAEADPQFNSQALSSDDPYEFAMQAWKRDQVVSQVSADDLDDYLAWKAAKAAPAQDAPIAAAPAVPQQTPPRPPPKSLADAPSAGGPAIVPSGPGKAFAGVFGQA